VDPLGLQGDGSLEVPTDFGRTGWYTGRPAPGEVGPAVIVGHVDSRRGPAVFYRLRQLRPGAEVVVHRGDGSRVTFVVQRSARHAKDSFPTAEVYGPTTERALRLVTCGGTFDRASLHYRDNVIVFARMEV
jgi:sortase (surface protein transpeptidase)